jgi:AcrR family transcriptional regulator
MLCSEAARTLDVKNDRSLSAIVRGVQIAILPPAKDSEARDRLLRTASAIFYTEGINSVGVDRIVSDSKVTRATFYRHFPSKHDLVLAYLQAAHDAIEAQLTEPTVETLSADVCAQIGRPEFRGCAFICAAAEFEDEQHPIRRAVAAHREWYLGVIRDAFRAAGHAHPEDAARHFVMLRDGAFVAGHLGDQELAIRTFRQGAEGSFTLSTPNP